MQIPEKKIRFALPLFVLLLLVIFSSSLVAADKQGTPETSQPGEQSDVHSTLAGLSDEQVRRLLLNELQQDQAESVPEQDKRNTPGSTFDRMLSGLAGLSADSGNETERLLAKLPGLPDDLYRVYVSICPGRTLQGALINTAWVIFFILAAFAIEFGLRKLVMPKLFDTAKVEQLIKPTQNIEKFTASLVLELPSFIGLFFFFAAAYLLYMWLTPTDLDYLRLLFLAILISITLVRTVQIVARVLFSPTSKALRIMPVECTMASAMYTMTVWAAGYVVIGMMFIVVTRKLGAQPATTLLLQLILASLLVAVTAFLILFYKNRIKTQILASATYYGEEPSWGRQQFASVWHIPALVYLACIWILLFFSLLDPEGGRRGAFILSFFILPIWIVADMMLQWIVRYAMETLKIHSDNYQDSGEVSDEELEIRKKGRQTFQKTLITCRLGLVLGMLVWVASLWNITVPFLSRVSTVIFDALIILTLAMFFWKFVSGWIERKIEESIPEEDENQEDTDNEWGAAATRGRSYTLLPMIRKFIGTILVTMVTLTILSALGVDIGPLLAGAGVVGLAVGFGAQKLVADMLSGFFYLLDDAFRVGEYVEAGGISGTVENISLRNVMLRHHRGMLQIVPHSELGSITNYMRGGIVVKFNLDFPYDAEIDKIRKIIKKVGIAMLEDPEYGEDFIRPVKSQGVREITNSVMTIRVKFTAKAGAHFVIRREAYKKITEALRAKGIEYAHKKVIVDLPPAPDGTPPSQEQIRHAAGAAAQKQIEEEQAAAEAAAAKQP